MIAACMRAIDQAEEALSPSPRETVPIPSSLGNLADEVSNAHSVAGRRHLSGKQRHRPLPFRTLYVRFVM